MATKARAVYGSGTKPARRKDGMWVARIESGWTPTGKRRRLVISAKTEAECKRRLKERQREILAGRAIGINVRATVKSWAEEWLPRHAQKVRPTTLTTDAGTIRKWIIPTLGHRRLAELTPADLTALRDAITGAGRSTTTAHHAHTVLRKMLRDALVAGHSVPDAVMKMEKPGKAASDRGALPEADAGRILAVVRERPNALRWVTSLLQGTRQGETLGLTWPCVDLAAALVDVSWQLQWLTPGGPRPDGWEERHLVGRAHLTRPKTAAGQRILPMEPWMSAVFDEAWQQWRPNPWGLIWTDEHGQPIKAEADRAEWKAIQAAAGVAHPSGRPWHIHEMRHTTASMLLEDGNDRKVIESILGQARLVDSYLHVGHDAKRAALGRIAERFRLLPSVDD